MAFFSLKPLIGMCNNVGKTVVSRNTWSKQHHCRVVAIGLLRGFCTSNPTTTSQQMESVVTLGKESSPSDDVTPVFRKATQHLNRVALKDRSGTHTYKEILKKSLILAGKIRQKIGPEKAQERIVFLCPNDVTYVVAQWACWAAGHIAVPLSTVHPPALLSYYIEDSEAALAISSSDASHVELMSSVLSKSPRLPLLVMEEAWSQQGSLPSSAPTPNNQGDNSSVRVEVEPPALDPELKTLLTENSMPDSFYASGADAMILYTSGTTGKPKGVLLSHANLDAQTRSLVRAWAWGPADVILHVLPLHHTHGIVNALLCPLSVGARCIMLPKFEASAVWANLLGTKMSNAERPSVFTAVPTVYSKLIEEYQNKFAATPKLKEFVKTACSTKMRLMMSGSAPLPEPVFHQWQSITGHHLLERYGMTEIGMALSNPLKGERRPGHVGLPLPDVRVRIAEFKTGGADGNKVYYDILAEGNCKATKVEPGKGGLNGELLIKGPNVFKKYWNNPDATEKEFTKDGWFKTGDIAQYDNGYYKILGRASADIIKSGGYKISALQIETELLAHPLIADVAVVGISDPTWGQKVTAVFVMKPSTDPLEADQLKAWCKEHAAIAPYAVPSVWKRVESMPRNAMGKVNKKELVAALFPSSN